jgi:hypothetical protein
MHSNEFISLQLADILIAMARGVGAFIAEEQASQSEFLSGCPRKKITINIYV